MIVVNARFLTQKTTGVQRFAIEISQQLKEYFKNEILFVSPNNLLNTDLAEKLEVKIIGNLNGHLWEQYELVKFLKSNNSPLLLNLTNTAPLFYKNKIVTIHDLAFYHHPEWFSKKFTLVYNFLIPRIAKNSKHIFTVSEYVKNDIIKNYKIKDEKVTVIYNSYSVIFTFKDLIREKFVLVVGSIDPRKNIKLILDIFTKNKMKLVVVGQKNKVFSSLDISNLPDNITFTGYLDDEKLVELYNKASLFLYPSLFEGFGIPPIEAQACGCPVLSSNSTSLPEVGQNSFIYCNPLSLDDINTKIESILNNEDLKEELRQKGFENIKRFSWENSSKKILSVVKGYID